MILGIDFGNCFSSIAVMIGDEPVTDYLEDDTGQGVPSCFLYNNGREYFGENCFAGNLPRSEIISKIKKEIRARPGNMDLPYVSGGRSFPLSEIVKKFLEYIIVNVEKNVQSDSNFKGNKSIEEVTITAPVAIGNDHELASNYRKFIQKSVSEITGLGLNNVHVFDEPAAAALSYLYKNPRTHYDSNQTVIVFDLGGGTLDIVVVEHDPRNHKYRIIDRDGDLDLGGDDWDNVLSKHICQRMGIVNFNNAEEEFSFKSEVTKLKIELSKSETYPFKFKLNGRIQVINITRKEFEEVSSELLKRALDKMESVVNHLPKGLGGIDKIILSGGSSNMPQIKNGLIERLRLKDNSMLVSWDPSRAIAKGAALHARMQNTCDYGVREEIHSIVPHTYGIATYINPIDDVAQVSNIIFKGCTFTTESFKQETNYYIHPKKGKELLKFEVYESNYKKKPNYSGDVVAMGPETIKSGMEMMVPVPDEYVGREDQFKVKISMSITKDGILSVSAIDGKTGRVIETISE